MELKLAKKIVKLSLLSRRCDENNQHLEFYREKFKVHKEKCSIVFTGKDLKNIETLIIKVGKEKL